MARGKGLSLIGRWGLIVSVIVSPAFGETFEDRWPYPVSVDPAPEGVWPKLEKKKVHRHNVVFVCHKKYYYKRGYRYWRCKR